MVFCFTEALLAYRTWPLQKKQAKTLHLALQSAGIILLRCEQSVRVCVCVWGWVGVFLALPS